MIAHLLTAFLWLCLCIGSWIPTSALFCPFKEEHVLITPHYHPSVGTPAPTSPCHRLCNGIHARISLQAHPANRTPPLTSPCRVGNALQDEMASIHCVQKPLTAVRPGAQGVSKSRVTNSNPPKRISAPRSDDFCRP